MYMRVGLGICVGGRETVEQDVLRPGLGRKMDKNGQLRPLK